MRTLNQQMRNVRLRQGCVCNATDTLIDNLTVFEMLLYTAELKLDMRMPFPDKCRKVAGVIDKLGLKDCRDVRIGSNVRRGISGTALRVMPCLPLCVSRKAALY
jgi:ABC-type multidrug transport system ATPase subunit